MNSDQNKAKINAKMHTVFLAVGSNLGDKVTHCRNGLAAIERLGIGVIVARSDCYSTEPVDYTDQDWFINAALKIETDLEPLALLAALKEIETEAGRKGGGIRFGPRVLDLDIIFYDNIVYEDEHVTIPHPRMHKRRFVLQPICDIDPQVIHPGLGQNVQTLLKKIHHDEQRIRPYPCEL